MRARTTTRAAALLTIAAATATILGASTTRRTHARSGAIIAMTRVACRGAMHNQPIVATMVRKRCWWQVQRSLKCYAVCLSAFLVCGVYVGVGDLVGSNCVRI